MEEFVKNLNLALAQVLFSLISSLRNLLIALFFCLFPCLMALFIRA